MPTRSPALHTHIGQRGGEAGDPVNGLGHRANPVAVDRGRPVGVLLQAAVQRLG